MSQHQIHVNSPKVGRVLVTVGYDPMLHDAFLTILSDDDVSYMSPSGLGVTELEEIALEQLGRRLPQRVIDGLKGDVADLRLGATDIGRRITRYEVDGTIAHAAKW